MSLNCSPYMKTSENTLSTWVNPHSWGWKPEGMIRMIPIHPKPDPPKKRWDGHYSSSKCLSRFVQKISPNMNCGGTFEVDCPFNIPWSPYQLVGLPCLPYLCRWEITVSLLVTLGSTFTVRCGKSHHLNIFRMAFPVAFPHLTISQQRTMLPSITLERTRNPGAHMRPASVPSWDWIY